jgi:hypothetical protein
VIELQATGAYSVLERIRVLYKTKRLSIIIIITTTTIIINHKREALNSK